MTVSRYHFAHPCLAERLVWMDHHNKDNPRKSTDKPLIDMQAEELNESIKERFGYHIKQG